MDQLDEAIHTFQDFLEHAEGAALATSEEATRYLKPEEPKLMESPAAPAPAVSGGVDTSSVVIVVGVVGIAVTLWAIFRK
jgi:hypothetical protein